MAKPSLYEILAEDYPDGNYTQSQLWEAIAEADGYELDYYEDGDLAEWLQGFISQKTATMVKQKIC